MSGMENGMETVTLRVNRFTPRPERSRERGGSPFARKSSPFGDSGSARRRPRGKQWVQDYVVPARPEDTVLDCLLKVKRTIDPTLAFRYSCGHGMCGSDAVSINGTPTLLCTATVKAWAKQPSDAQVDEDGFRHTGEDVQPAQTQDADDLGVIELAPLPGFPVQRDLIADIDQMLGQIRKLKPYLQASGELATTADGKINAFEYLQNPQQLSKYELLSNYIACGTCEEAVRYMQAARRSSALRLLSPPPVSSMIHATVRRMHVWMPSIPPMASPRASRCAPARVNARVASMSVRRSGS